MAQLVSQKYALVVGCNYPGSPIELKGSINDANSIHEMLINRFKFDYNNVEMLTDEPGSLTKPTAENIKSVLTQFILCANPGDLVFLFFSGFGTTVSSTLSLSGKDEQAIVPCDYNLISSVDFRDILDGAPDGVTFVFMSDSGHSGGLIDQEKEQIGPYDRRANVSADHHTSTPKTIGFEVILQQLSCQAPINDVPSVHTHLDKLFGSKTSLIFRKDISLGRSDRVVKPDDGILLSGCLPDETCAEQVFDGRVHGSYTWAVLSVLKGHPGPITHEGLVKAARDRLVDQRPCLYCNDKNVRAFFLNQKF